MTVSSISVSGSTVILTLGTPAAIGDVISVAYTAPTRQPLIRQFKTLLAMTQSLLQLLRLSHLLQPQLQRLLQNRSRHQLLLSLRLQLLLRRKLVRPRFLNARLL
jgi:hypothetical protein